MTHHWASGDLPGCVASGMFPLSGCSFLTCNMGGLEWVVAVEFLGFPGP